MICLQIHYMYGALFKQQARHLRQWIEDDEASGPKPVKQDFIVSVMFWTSTPSVSPVSTGLHRAACLSHVVALRSASVWNVARACPAQCKLCQAHNVACFMTCWLFLPLGSHTYPRHS